MNNTLATVTYGLYDAVYRNCIVCDKQEKHNLNKRIYIYTYLYKEIKLYVCNHKTQKVLNQY